MIKVSDLIIRILSKHTSHIFGGQGGSVLHMVDSIYKNKKIKFIPGQSEQGSSLAADAYYRSSGKLGVVLGTSGPGIINFIQGIACSYYDSVPALYLAGAPIVSDLRKNIKIRQIGFQEMEVQKLLKPLTKGIWLIKKKEEVESVFNKAISLSLSGRMGPVVIEIPDDIQRSFIKPKKIKNNFEKLKKNKNYQYPIDSKITLAVKLINKSRKPIIIAGHGIKLSKSTKLLEKFAKKNSIPYLYTWSSADQFNFNSRLNAGSFGVAATRGGNFSIQNSDLVIALGARFSPSLVGGNPKLFAPDAKKIIVDIDKHEFFNHRLPSVNLKIHSDVSFFLTKILNSKIIKKEESWIDRVNFFKKKYPVFQKSKNLSQKYLDPYYFFDALSRLIKKNSILIPDASANLIWAMQAFKVIKKVKIFTAFNHSPMGYSIAASIGAFLGSKKSTIIATIGDGSVPMNVQELETIKNYNIDVKIFVFNNKGYSLIKQTQETWLKGKYSGVDKSSGLSLPDNLRVAKAYGIKTMSIMNNQNLEKNISKALKIKGPVLIDLNINPLSRVEPKIEYGRPLHDMSPSLPKKEIIDNMKK
jgi:acetolactate synthase-1/2/3 large subunit